LSSSKKGLGLELEERLGFFKTHREVSCLVARRG